MKDILVLFDINGSLGLRCDRPMYGLSPQVQERFHVFYERPGALDAVNKVRDLGAKVAISTNIKMHNALRITGGLGFKGVKIFDQTFADQDHVLSAQREKPSFVRNIRRIWADLRGRYDETNTIIVENDGFAKNMRANTVLIPTMDAEDLRDPDPAPMAQLAKYLEKLMRASPRDVRDYLRQHPLQAFRTKDQGRSPDSPSDSVETSDEEDVEIKDDDIDTTTSEQKIYVMRMINNSHDVYRVLGVNKQTTPEQIRSAYRMLSKIVHPDRNPHSRATEAFQILQNAFEKLGDGK